MKRIYLIQPSDVRANTVYLPYAVGTLAAYALGFSEIQAQYTFEPFLFKKDPIEEVLNRMQAPYLVGFSCYMWNIEYNLALAQEIHARFPDAILVFGGPQIPNDISYLAQYPFLQILMHGEGERTFKALLEHLANREPLSDIPNLSYRTPTDLMHTKTQYSRNVAEFPSPYTAGVFDSIVDDPKFSGYRFEAILESNRGCPYGCIYCNWAGTKENFRQFPLDRVKSDLIWMAKHKIVFCICADSNFGILERDKEIAEFVVSLKQKYGYPKKIETAAAKNKDDDVFQINRILESANLNCGISVAVQSFSPTVLKNIGRQNISIDNFSDQLKKYRQAGIATYTDLIIALPGETFESFCRGIFQAFEAGQHLSINIHPCELLPNTILALPETIEKYAIHTIRSMLCQDHCSLMDDNRFGSRSEIVVSTNTMTSAQWRTIMRISVCAQGFHSFGLLRCFAIYCRRALQISYYDFYMGLYHWIETESRLIKPLLDKVCKTVDLFLEEKSSLFFYDEKFSDLYLPFKEAIFLYCVDQLDRFYADVRVYLQRWISDERLLDDLIVYQKMLIALPSLPDRQARFAYDWYAYFHDIFDTSPTAPICKPTNLLFKGTSYAGWYDYTREALWFGKRSNKMLNPHFPIS